MILKAPFPWFGGKSRVAPEVWQAFGDVKNYVEPFLGSGAVLLGRPHPPQIETVNDKDGFVANFFRAVKHSPDETAEWASQMVNECDLHAQHIWLLERRATLNDRLCGDPAYCDPQIAGWWVWGVCCWIGSGWCSGKGPWSSVDGVLTRTGGASQGVNRKLPYQKSAGMGVKRQLPHLGDAGRGVNRQIGIRAWFTALFERFARVRVCCGDWSRVCGPSVTFKHGVTGVFLDPPYSAGANRADVYTCEDMSIAHAVLEWCLANGDNHKMRIALCGYAGEHDALEASGWRVHAWKASGGYGNQGDTRGRENANRERIWFSPHCLTDSRTPSHPPAAPTAIPDFPA